MTFAEAKQITPYMNSIVVKKTGRCLRVVEKYVHYPDKDNNGTFVLLKCDDGVWYSHTEVNIY